MSNLLVDIDKLNESGQDIIRLSRELNEEFNALFSRISNITNTGEWIGQAAEDFVRRTNLEKIQYLKMKDSIYKYGKSLLDVCDEYKKAINNLR